MDRLPAWLLETPLLAPWTVPLCVAVGVLLVLGLWVGRTRRRPWWVQALVVGVPAALALAAWWWVNVVWAPIPDGVAGPVFAWAALPVVVLAQAAVGPWRPRPLRWGLGGVVAVLAAALCAALGVNAHYSTYESLAVMTGRNVTWTDWDAVDTAPARQVVPVDRWTAPAGLPEHGTVSRVGIPATDARLAPRDAVVYLPPAYFAEERPALPVMILMAGVPGEPPDWFSAGHAAETMDAYAAAHHGLAPIVLSVDANGGGALTNRLCWDGPDARVETYLTQDVPAWIGRELQTDRDRTHWAIGGLSNGATCALQTVARTPDGFGTVLVFSGELHPSLGTEERTIAEGFGGDRAAYAANDPLSLFAAAQRGEGPGADGAYRGVAGVVSVGRSDAYVGMPVPQELVDAGRAAGMDLTLREYPGGHTWTVWSRAFADQLPWAAGRMGLG